mmetsp:Transcript_34516/g.86709  ORF Transcript_34516/g.86709 Transcript_34516/m.86709 type:complete len:334 (+) Transcript_34516:571-1572(+)
MLRIFDAETVVRHSKLDKHIPGCRETRTTQGATVEGRNFVQIVDITVLQRITVSIAFKGTSSRDFQFLHTFKHLVVRNILVVAVLNEFHTASASKNNVTRVPGELVSPRIVIRLRSNQTARKRFEAAQTSFLGANMIDVRHRNHVINSWIEADLVQQDDITIHSSRMHGRDIWRNIRSSDHVLAQLDAVLEDATVQLDWQQGDHNVGFLDFCLASLVVFHIEGNWNTIWMAFDFLFCSRARNISHSNTPVLLLGMMKKVANQRGSTATCAKQDNGFATWVMIVCNSILKLFIGLLDLTQTIFQLSQIDGGFASRGRVHRRGLLRRGSFGSRLN